MPRNCVITFKTDPETKGLAAETCRALGMDLSTAMNVLLRRFVAEGGFPFLVKTGFDAETLLAFREADEIASGKKTAKRFSSVQDLVADIMEDPDEEI